MNNFFSKVKYFVLLFCVAGIFLSCNASNIKDLIDVADGVPRKSIDTSILGINSFVNDSRFGSIRDQFLEVRDTLRLKFVRVLFAWDDNVQPTPQSSPNFSFYDSIVQNAPSGLELLVVVTGVPRWMFDPANWVNGNPRETFVKLWVKKVVERYGSSGKIVGFEVWNEPNQINDYNITLDVVNNPANFVELLSMAYTTIKAEAPSKLVLNGATTSINQNFPNNLNYNKRMVESGVLNFVDKYAIHYYGRQFENVVRTDGVEDFLLSLGKGVWVTESGIQGVNNQLAYGEQVWPFLREKISNIERIYIYQHTEATDPQTTFGLRNLSADFPVSDLYIFLRDRA
ncbi:MAG: hypothetical protein D6780_07080 [Candidatus Dadabacteria bacterium]|nr:MAG: hypothetical protein D6780_07080 [Candidatus Dadabacteria bacterium]